MKQSLLFATLVLAFGLAVGCSDDKKSGKSGGGDNSGNVSCNGSNERYSDYYDECLVVNSCPSGYGYRPGSNQCVLLEPGGGFGGGGNQAYAVIGDVNITNGKKFEAFLESYGYSAYGSPFCSDNRDNSIFMFQFGILGQDCATFNNAQILIQFSDPEIAGDNSTYAQVYLYVYSQYAGSRTLMLPIGHSAEVRRSNGDTEFRMQGTLNKLVSPPDLAQWIIKGDTIDYYDQGGTSLQIIWDGSVVATADAPLY